MSLLKHAPRLEVDDAVRLAREVYGLTGTAHPLPSERDQNFLLSCDTGRYVLKIANATESRAFLEAQNAALAHVARSISVCPEVIPAADGLEIVEIAPGVLVRMVKWIDGVPLARVRAASPHLLEAFGRMLGRVDASLTTFDHPAVHREFHWDLARAFQTAREWLPLVADAEWRRFVAFEIDGIEQRQASRLSALRRSVIHNDANDHNVLTGGGTDLFTRNQEIRGLIDFGDMVHTCTVADPAVAIAYAVLDKPGPLRIASDLLRGYQHSHPLDDRRVRGAVRPRQAPPLFERVCGGASAARASGRRVSGHQPGAHPPNAAGAEPDPRKIRGGRVPRCLRHARLASLAPRRHMAEFQSEGSA